VYNPRKDRSVVTAMHIKTRITPTDLYYSSKLTNDNHKYNLSTN